MDQPGHHRPGRRRDWSGWGLFRLVETRAVDPILPWTILTSRTFIVSTLVGMLAMGGMIGVLSYLPTYLQMVYGYSATTSGLLLVPITIGMLLSSILSGVLVSRTDRYKIYPVAGPLVAAGAAFWLSRLSTTSPVWQISAATFLMGGGHRAVLPAPGHRGAECAAGQAPGHSHQWQQLLPRGRCLPGGLAHRRGLLLRSDLQPH